MQKNVKILQKLTEELLELMGTKAGVQVAFDKESGAFMVNIDAGDETGLLIGRKGETLSAIQTMLSFLLKQKTGEWLRVLANVGDYREKEESYLRELAFSTAQRAKETGEPQRLYNLKPWQRRVVHLTLAEDKDLTTESEGEGEERYLVVAPRK